MTLLVLTALEETWGGDEPLLFLGEWCKRYERRHVWSERTSDTVPFHWDDREKLLADYTHLEGLHTRLLGALSSSLNEFHGVDHSLRYWQILLDPWLVAYVAVLFDRWECVRVAFDGRPACTSWFVEDEHCLRPPYSYREFLEQTQSDRWNQQVYQAILEHAFADRVSVRWVRCDRAGKVGSEEGPGTSRSGNKAGVVARTLDRLLAQVSGDYRVVLKAAGFNWRASAKLNFALGQVPRWFFDLEGEAVGTPRDPAGDLQARRERLAVAWSPESDFERFLARVLARDLPTMVIEDFETLSERAGASPLRARVAVTAGSHWTDVGAKFWFAEGVERGMKLLISEHGGSLPPLKELFGFEEGIADAKCTWFRPYHPKHRQLPPSRLVERFRTAARTSGRRGGCLILANECPRWVHRAQFYPMAGQWIMSFEMVLALVDDLEEPVRRRTRVKPYPNDQGWNTAARLVDALGADHVLTGRSLDEALPDTRIVVCTYPETTFAEAMASGVPTVLMYPQRLYELNPVALPLLARLKQAEVVFHDAISAAAHINRIWDDPDAWWSSEPLRRVRAEFREQATDVRGDWLRPWLDLLNEVSH